ncbi:MAG: hypothetical protein WC211_05415 [Dehalococcoidia bacterium]
MKTVRRTLSLATGGLLALAPAAAMAEGASRALPAAPDAFVVFSCTLAGLAGLMLVAALGWLYQQKRGLHWDFQADASHANDHH